MSMPDPTGMLQHFKYEHLREELQPISKLFAELAEAVVLMLPSNPERTVALRKLLEGKDAAVRAKVMGNAPKPESRGGWR